MVRISEPNSLGDAWSCAFEGKTTIEPSTELRVFGGVFVEQPCERPKRDLWRPIDRISLWLSSIESTAGELTPPAIEWELRARAGNASHRLMLVAMSPTSWEHRGLIVQFAGVLCVGFDVFARVTTSGAKPVRVNVTAVVDRSGAQLERIVGESVVLLP
ncbi:MAG: hypothetical protein U0269_30705 [Polyangiales bacterium]